ncbi:DNA (cytosine-5-)-methyltransferase [Photobacterium damselae subsp. damselae]|nr:DNA (cytosine-5-)-methyltransferase [Photobacterium damselae]NVH48989.1 DNA (cytosine-5-)-methyltransferase [Photobacterium damselae subsp. damselae]
MINLYSGSGFFTLKQLFGHDEWVKLPDNRTIGKKFKQAVVDNEFPQVKLGPKTCSNEQQYILNKSDQYKFIDLFAGIGGFHIGLDRAGARCVFSSEIDKYARMTYKENFYHKNKELFDNGLFNSDITKISDYKNEIPDFDILCGGFPCQPFSQAGFKRGFDETKENRGNMFNIISNIIEEKRPQAFFLENVRHLLKHDNGNTFDVIKNRLEKELNYTFHYKVIKASDYGLPQHRPRIFMVGFRKGSVDLPEFKFPEPQPLILSMSDIFSGQCNKKIGFTLRVGGRRSGVHDRRNWDGYIVDGETRYLTPVEGKKMQGFPESFYFPVSEVQAMKQLGNSVAINAVEATAKEIIKYIDKHRNLLS